MNTPDPQPAERCATGPITLTFRIKIYKSREVLCFDGKRHVVGIECLRDSDEPIDIGPLDSHHGLHAGNIKEITKLWTERRALLSAAVALADAQFADMLSEHNIVSPK